MGRQYIGEIGKTDLSFSAKNNGLTVNQDPRRTPSNSNTRSDHYFQASSNGNVVVTTHLYDGKKSFPLDIELYQHAQSLPQGKLDSEVLKKPELALDLIDKSLTRGLRPGIVLIDSGYGNNTTFLSELEKRKLKYLGGVAKNRKIKVVNQSETNVEIRLDVLAQSLA